MTSSLLSDTHIPATFREVTFDDYSTPDDDTFAILDAVESWRPTARRPNLILEGKAGLGKTMLAAAVLNEYQRDMRFILKESGESLPAASVCYLRQQRFPVYFVQLAELIALHIRSFKLFELVRKDACTPEEYLALDQLLQDLNEHVEVLVVDDVGKEHHTRSNFAEDEFDKLVRTRYFNGLATIYTSNLPMKRWSWDYSEPLRNLLERSSLIVHF